MGLFKNYGAVKDSEDPRDLLYEEIIGSPKEALPLKFILPPERIKRIKNQGRTSSCVAQSASYVQGYQLKKDLSAKFAFKYCKILSGLKWGAYTRDGAKVAVNTGICDEDLLPEQKTYSDNAYLNFTVVPKALQNAHDNRAEIYVRVDGMYGNDFEVVKRFINREQDLLC